MRVFFVSLLLLSASIIFVGCDNPSDNPSVKKAGPTPDPKGEGPKAVPAGLGITLTAGRPDAAQNIVLSWNTDKISTSSAGGVWFVEITNPKGSFRSVRPSKAGTYTAVKPAQMGLYRYRVRYQTAGGKNIVSNSVSIHYVSGKTPSTNAVKKEINTRLKNTGVMNENAGKGGFDDEIGTANKFGGSNRFPKPIPPGDLLNVSGFDLVAYWGDWSTWQHRTFDISHIPQDSVSSIAYAFFKITKGETITLRNVGRTVTPPWGVIIPADDGSAFATSTPPPPVKLWPADPGGSVGWGKGNLKALKGKTWADTGLSVGGWTLSAEFRPLAADAAAKRTGTAGAGNKVDAFVQSTIMYLDRYDLKIADLDWEFPENNTHRQGFKDLVHYLRLELDNKWPTAADRREISIAITGNPKKMKFVPLDDAEFMNNVDRVKIMTYDFAGAYGPMTGHHTNLFGDSFHGKSTESGKTTDYGVDAAVKTAEDMMRRADASKLTAYKKKIRIGVAYYGRGWANVEVPAGWQPEQNADPSALIGLTVPKSATLRDGSATYGFAGSFGQYGTINYTHIRRYFLDYARNSPQPYSGKGGFYRLWDDKAKAPMLYSPTEKVLITYDDNESIAAKVKYANDNGLGGVLVWMISEDYNGELTAAINREANKYSW